MLCILCTKSARRLELVQYGQLETREGAAEIGIERRRHDCKPSLQPSGQCLELKRKHFLCQSLYHNLAKLKSGCHVMATPTRLGTPVAVWEPTFVQSMGARFVWNTIFAQSMGAEATIPIGDLADDIGWPSDKACILD